SSHPAELRRLLPDADLRELDTKALRPIEARGKELAEAAHKAREGAAQAKSAYDTQAGALAPRRQVLEREQRALQRDSERIRQRAEASRVALASLPPFLSVP